MDNNDWTTIKTDTEVDEDYVKGKKTPLEIKRAEFQLQDDLLSNILERLKYFVKKAKGDKGERIFKVFTDFCLTIVDLHVDRVDKYVNSVDINAIENQDVRSGEVSFLKECFAKVTKVNDTISDLNIREDNIEGDIVSFREDEKVPLIMHEKISKDYPDIQKKLDSMGIDFDSPPKQDMMILMDKIPKWNKDKHYWNQDKEVLQFYVDEFKKLRDGIKIDGIYFSGWLYFHINIFNASYPIVSLNKISGENEVKDKIGIPPLRDNEWFVINDNYEKAKKEGKMLFLAATRRAAKTTMEASHLDYSVTLGKKKILCVAGDTKDLGQLQDKLKVSQNNKNNAFRVPLQVDDWTKDVIYGLKTKNGKNIESSIISVINLEKGGASSSEKLAGYTPDAVVIDEIMKLPFKEQLEALKPALDAPGGKRCVVLLSGTSGNVSLAKDAFSVLSDPQSNGILEMNWDRLEEMAGGFKSWKRRSFGTFIPAQMSAKDGLKKLETTLSKFLKIESERLNKIPFQVTDWEGALNTIETDRKNKKKDRILFIKEKLYYPIDPEEMLLSPKTNPFPHEEAQRHLDNLRTKGKTGRKVDLVKDNGKVVTKESAKGLPEFPHGGGFHDSPVVLFEDIPLEKPPLGLYTCGLDDYKQEEADSDSLGCFYIYKRQAGGDEWGDRIVAAYTSRPDPHSKFHRWGFMLMEAFNAECLMENEDMQFKVYLDTLHKTEQYLVPAFDMGGSFGIKSNGRRKYGISPQGNKSTIINKVVNYCKEPYISNEKDENGEPIVKLGVEQIDDEMLLEEIINYREGNNHDRITTFGITLIQAHKMDAEYVPIRLTERKFEENQDRRAKTGNKFFTNTRRKLF